MNDLSKEFFMNKAVKLADKHTPSPNPKVGAVIVKEGQIIGQGAHEKAGMPHAEINALNNAIEDPKNSEMYVTLEPCSHYGKTPPCTEAIIKSGIKKVYIGMIDCDKKVSGRGIKKLNEAGILTDVLDSEYCMEINKAYIKHRTENRPYVILKTAMTLDGKISTQTGDSKWITNEKSREYVHKLRSQTDAVLVGGNTFRVDNPSLNVRLETINKENKNPVRIIITNQKDIDYNKNIFKTDGKVIIASFTDITFTEEVSNNGICEIHKINFPENRLDLFLNYLGNKNICSLLIEGGAAISGWFLKENMWDELIYFYAPKITCDQTAKVSSKGFNIEKISDSIDVEIKEILRFGDDFAIKAVPKK